MGQQNRKKLYVDPELQGTMLTRVFAYWTLSIGVIFAMVVAQVIAATGVATSAVVFNRVLIQFGPALLAALLILPVVMYDCLKVTHKFAGQLTRLRMEMKNLAEGEPVEEITFRKEDLTNTLAEEFNHLVKSLRADHPSLIRPNGQTDTTVKDTEVLATT